VIPLLELLKKYSVFIIVGAVIVVFLFFFRKEEDREVVTDLNPAASLEENSGIADDAEQPSDTSVVIDVKGEVQQPGVYEVSSEARVNDAIELAGGFTASANQSSVNLAQKVQDEMVILIPGEHMAADHQAAAGSSSDKVRINYASQEEIESLSGIGPSKAEAIIQYRDENGYFQSAEDLLEISGIGESTLENIEEEIIVP